MYIMRIVGDTLLFLQSKIIIHFIYSFSFGMSVLIFLIHAAESRVLLCAMKNVRAHTYLIATLTRITSVEFEFFHNFSIYQTQI